MNQILAYLLLIVVSMGIAFPLSYFGLERYGEAAVSYHDFAEQSKIRSGQSIAVTYLCSVNGTDHAKGTVVNTGLHNIEIFAALADGAVLCTNGDPGNTCPGPKFTFENYTGAPVGSESHPFEPETIVNFAIDEPVIDAVRLVTVSGKLFEIPVSANLTAICGP